MTTEKLIIQIESDMKALKSDLARVDKDLNDVSKSTAKTDSSMAKLGKVGGIAGAALLKVGAAGVAAATAITAIAVASAKGSLELEQLSRQAKLTVEDFKALSFATGEYGINAEQVADISKDMSDKLGEFATAGTGAFQDFVDVMGMTKEQGVELSKEFQNMSSDKVIGEMVKRMEDAGASSNQMTFALESMGNDLSKLVPLFSSNSAELNKMTAAYKAANDSMALTASQAQDLKELSASFSLMSDTAGNAATSISATLAPTLSEFFNDVIKIIPQAEQAIVNFINRFIDVEKINSLEGLNKEFERNTAILQENHWAQEQLESGAILTGKAQDIQIAALERYNEALERSNELIFQKADIEAEAEAKKLADAKAIGDDAKPTGSSGTTGAITPELEALQARFKSEEELLTAKYEKEQALARGNKELLAELEDEFLGNLLQLDEESDTARREAESDRWLEYIEEKNQREFDAEIEAQQKLLSEKLINEEGYLDAVAKLGKKYGKLDEKDVDTLNKNKEKSTWEYADSAMDAAGAIFGNNKAVSSTLAFINTAEGVTAALAKYDFGGAAIIAATGAAQIASINSADVGSSGSVSSPSAISPAAEDTSRVSSSVEVNESVAGGGSTSSTLTFTAEDGDELANVLADIINSKINSGEKTLG